MEALFQVYSCLVGQSAATRQVVNYVISHLLLPISEPMVLLFAEASDHGESELAQSCYAVEQLV